MMTGMQWCGSQFFQSVLVAALLFVGQAAVNGAIVVTDGFDDGNRTNTPDGISWFSMEGVTVPTFAVADDSGGLGTGNALFISPSSTNQEIMGVFDAPISIPAGVGSKLTVRFDMRNDHSSVPGGTFRFGLFNSDAPIGTDGFGTSDGDFDVGNPENPSFGTGGDVGNWVQLNNDGGFGNGNLTRIREELNSVTIPGNNLVILGGTDVDAIAQPPGAFPAVDGANGKTTIELVIERIAPGDDVGTLYYTFTMTTPTETATFGGWDEADTIPGSTTSTFDYILMMKSAGNPWVIDNLVISVDAVPEPSTCGMILLALSLGLVARRRAKMS